jgi:hypothetical protein
VIGCGVHDFAVKPGESSASCTKNRRELRQRTELLMLRAKTRLSYVLNRARAARARRCERQEMAIEPSTGSTPEFLKIEQLQPVR